MARGPEPLSRYEIHEMILRQMREKVVELTKLRAVGLSQPQDAKRAGLRKNAKLGEEGGQPEHQVAQRAENKEKRTCNNCGVKGHIARNCTSPTTLGESAPEREDKKRQQIETEEKLPTPPRLNAHYRLGPPRGTPAIRGRGGNYGGRPVNPRNPHMTEGVTCTHCGTINHSAAQCWTLHPKLCPHPKRTNAMMAQHEKDDMAAYRVWQTEQHARKERCRRYEEEREKKELLRADKEDAQMDGGNNQFMATC